MPKRIPTPPPPDDEPRYLTVVHPYPGHANMELDVNRKIFSLWMASCIGEENLIAFFHKPLSPNMIIIEIPRDFTQWRKLLGAHRWSEFLQRPSADEKDRVSKVFHCTYKDGRAVQKHGWKRIYVEDKWFNNWASQSKKFTHPYPQTHHCDVPREDCTNCPLCRPLPVAHFPAPPTARRPPVGSTAWTSKKSVNVAEPVPTRPAADAWGGGGVPPSQAIPIASMGSNSGGASPNIPSNAGNKSSARTAPKTWAHVAALPSPLSPDQGTPPGLVAPNVSSSSSISSASPTSDPDPPPLVASGRSISSATTSSDDDSAGWHNALDGDEDEGNTTISPDKLSHAMASLTIEGNLHIYAGENDGDQALSEDMDHASVDRWATFPAESEAEEFPGDEQSDGAEAPMLCTMHNKVCGRGICKVYKDMIKNAEKEARKAQENQQDKRGWRNTGQRGGRGGKAGGVRSARTTGAGRSTGTTIREKPPHLGQRTSGSKASASKANESDGAAMLPRSTPSPSPISVPASNSASPPSDSTGTARNNARAASKASAMRHISNDQWGGSIKKATNGTPSVAGSSAVGVSAASGSKDDPWHRIKVDDDARSVAASSTSGWGSVPNEPWPSSARVAGTKSAGKKRQFERSWADDVDDELANTRSVAANPTNDWGVVSDGPW